MLAFLGHGLAKASRSDKIINNETAALRDGFTFSMGVMSNGPVLHMRKDNGGLVKIAKPAGKPDLDIQFKHLGHAFGTLSFQEGTAEAFARERMVVDGDIPASMKLVRCFERVEVLTLPKLIACRIMRHYPPINITEKLAGAAQIYLGVMVGFVMGNKK